MSNPIIIFENPEDPTRVCMMTPTGEVPIEELLQRHVNTSRPYKVCDASLLSSPTLDPLFVDAWSLSANADTSASPILTVHMPNARDLWRNKLRGERAPILQSLDVQYMRAMEANDTHRMTEIAAQKNKLRDMPADPRIEAAVTTDALKQLTLEVLLQ